MKVSEQWLRQWVNPAVSIEELGHQLTMAGLELDGIEPVAATFSKVVIGQIEAVEQHPDADRLRVCQVNVGEAELLQIVTNIASVAPKMRVPVAMIGAELAGETPEKPFKIKKSKLRGVLSQGMFCGADTLGVSTGNDEGLLELAADALLGQDIREYLQLDDCVLDIDLTPNRADCLSVAGIAREVGVLTQTTVTKPSIPSVEVTSRAIFPVTLRANEACPHYVGRVIENVNVQAQSPLWLTEALRRAGLRSLSPIVDVTNYVMLELGQPLHAFDFACLDGGIEVRYAQSNEALTLLDGQAIKLSDDTLVIADQQKALALAGIMGGESSAVSDNTQTIFLESAFFTPEKIAGKARKYGLHTDSSHRFERGVAPDLQVQAIERASQLILDICGGQAGALIEVSEPSHLPQKSNILLRRARIQHLLGIRLADERVVDILQGLECKVVETETGWDVTPPLFRFDLAIEADLIEELARIYGYDKIPPVLRKISPRITVPKETTVGLNAFAKTLVERGYQEAVTFSFVAPDVEQQLSADQTQGEIRLANPISADLAVMRSTLWSGLLPALSANLKRQQSRVRLFESGLTFVKTADGIVQPKKLAGVMTGTVAPEQWGMPARKVDFYDVKGDVEALLRHASAETYYFAVADHPALHPGQSTMIMQGEDEANAQCVGYVGAMHPRLEKTLGINQTVFLFELDLTALQKKRLPAYQAVSRYPSIRRDLALVVDAPISALMIEKTVKQASIPQLIQYTVFDVYTGDGVEKGRKSVALSLILQDFSRTLEENKINGAIDQVVDLLKTTLNASLR